MPLGWRMADAYLAVALALALELLAVALASRRELAGIFEVGYAVLGLLPVALTAAAPAALLAGALLELCRAGEGRRSRLALGLVAGIFAAAVAFGVSGGRRVEGVRPYFVAALAAAAFAGAWALAGPLARALGRTLSGERSRALRGALPAAALGAFTLLELANVTILPRLYPAFHHALGALALLAASFAALPLDPSRRARVRRAAAALGLFAVSAAVSPFTAKQLTFADNVRIVYLERAPLLGQAVVLASSMAPPPPVGDLPEAEATASARAIDLEGRDVVLVTIDALRADHVGAYGYGRPITPEIDRLAAEGALFEAAYTQTPHTSYALTSLLTGKYMRPLILQGLGGDSETLALHLRRYGYQTAAFYPPAIFFIDEARFAPFRERGLDFEYARVEFARADERVRQVEKYLEGAKKDAPTFLWVHLFEPHEPYEAHGELDLGDRDVDRYDAEIAAADAAVGGIVRAVRARRPGAVVIVTADHGEEFLDHGGRYHGTTVYEEQVRVPLVVSAPGRVSPRRIPQPVQLVDLLPTILSGIDVPRPARVRGRDLGPLLAGAPLSPEQEAGFAFAETETQTLLARRSSRLVCARRIGACALYDVDADPGQRFDLAKARASEVEALRAELRALEASHGRYEVRGLRAEGKGWPEALRRGIAGDADAAGEVAALLDDADLAIRRKAGEVLFDLRRPESASFLRLAAARDEDEEVRKWAALALTRLGEGAARARELVKDRELRWRRLAALALAEAHDDRGEDVLVAWFRAAYAKDVGKREREALSHERALEVVEALARIKSEDAVVPMIHALDDVRLRPHLARALARIGEDSARPALAARLETERYETARVAIAESLVALGAGPELRAPLVRLLGTPDPLPNGLRIAVSADVLDLVGGPRKRDLARLRRFATSGVAVGMVVPKAGDGLGVRVLCRARSTDDLAGEIRFGLRTRASMLRAKVDRSSLVPARAPELDPARSVGLPVPPAREPLEVFAKLPDSMGIEPGSYADFVVYATQNVELEACAVVPLSRELPPPPPEPWKPPGGNAEAAD